MPIYEYVCTACEHRADILHGINDPGPHFCPSCGREGTMRKQFAPPTIHFKGSGWAKKDRGSPSATRAASRAGSAGDGAAAKSSGDAAGGGSSGDAAERGSSGGSSGGTTGSSSGDGAGKRGEGAGRGGEGGHSGPGAD